MCGLYGYIGSGLVDVKRATDAIVHRGPDSEGFYTWNRSKGSQGSEAYCGFEEGEKVILGFRRLAIIDLESHSNQPLHHESGQYSIVFNGEIYNYLEIKDELIKIGVNFTTYSDTEVLLKAFVQWGLSCFERFNGMWACLILDKQKNELIVSRDRFGIKPLFYEFIDDGIHFFSEIKQALADSNSRKVDDSVIRDYLESGVLDATEQTFYSGINRFKAGHFATISLHQPRSFEQKSYFEIGTKVYPKYSYPDAVSEFRTLFKDSIELRFRSDVPIGACLSGGLDSSSIVSFAGFMGKEINAFSIDNKDKELSEIQYVRDVVNKYPQLKSVVSLNEDNDIELLDQVIRMQDEPISNLSVLSQWRVMRLTSENKVVVLLDGQGGDEIFGGYRKFVFFYLKELVQTGKIGLAIKEASRFLSATEFKLFEAEGLRRYLNKTGVHEFLSEELLRTPKQHNIGLGGATGFKEKSLDDIYKYSYPQLLRYEDRNSMAFSLESRVPFLDYRLVDFVYSLPTSYKLRNGFTKAILRDSMEGILPDSVRLRRSKLGFATPERRWMEQTHLDFFKSYFERMDNPYLKCERIFEDFKSGNNMDYRSLIRIFIFDRWFQINSSKLIVNS